MSDPTKETDFARRRDLSDAITDAEHSLENARGAYLRATGWRYTSSNNPRCMWLWEKNTSNGKVTASTNDAVEQQKAIDSLDGVYDDVESVEG